MTSLLHRLIERLAPHPAPSPTRVNDAVGEDLRAAIAAGARAKVDNSRTYEARVRAMMDDFFLEMRDHDARPRP